jgi:hypothetical protein
LDIADWWNKTRLPSGRLVLSSRRLIAVLRYAGSDSALKSAVREDWDDDTYLMATLINEIRIMRADNVAIHSGQKMEPILMRSPKQVAADEEASQEKAAIRGGIMAQLYGGVNE